MSNALKNDSQRLQRKELKDRLLSMGSSLQRSSNPASQETLGYQRIGFEDLVYIIDDNETSAQPVAEALRSVNINISYHASGTDFLNAYESNQNHSDLAECILLDLRLPHVTGDHLQKLFQEYLYFPPFMIITGFPDIAAAVEAMHNGAVHFYVKPVNTRQLLDSVNRALNLDCQNKKRMVLGQKLVENLQKLTGREMEIYGCILRGLSNDKMANQFGISIKTVELHRSNLVRKSGCGTIAELIRISLVSGLAEQLGIDDI